MGLLWLAGFVVGWFVAGRFVASPLISMILGPALGLSTEYGDQIAGYTIGQQR